jgi:hypothetical protein
MRNVKFVPLLGMAILAAVGGCNKTATPASTDNSANAPAGSQAQSQNAPAPAPAPAPPRRISVPAGTVLTVSLDSEVSSKTNNSGDRFEASLAEPVTLDGETAIPAGARATGTITDAKSAGRFKGGASLALTLDAITVHGQRYQIESSSFEDAGKGRGKRTAVGAGGGAALGAVVGALAGGGKGAAIGALAGGGAGTAGAAFTGKRDITLPAETRLHFKLEKPVSIVEKSE